MARRTRSGGDSPNKVLVIFLVLFILLNIATGVWAYTLLQERDKWSGPDQEISKKNDAIKAAQNAADWNKYKSDELRAAIGDPQFINKADYMTPWAAARKEFLAGSRFPTEPDRFEFLDTVKFLDEKLGGFGDVNYKKKFAEIEEPANAKIAKLQTDLAEITKEKQAWDADKRKWQNQYESERIKLVAKIKSDNEAALAERQKASDSLTKAFEQNENLRKELDAQQDLLREDIKKQAKEIRDLNDKLKAQIEAAKNPNRALQEPHALVLDISRGKTMWDLPRGKITRLEEGTKRVFIDKGAKDGVKPGLTFLVFAPTWNGRAEGELKATIEVVRVDGDHSSQCRISSYYDIDGHEVPASETAGKVLREGGTPLKEGDFIFNLMWGSHVAIAGLVDFTGSGTTTAAGQMDALIDFMRHLERIGVIIDAYVDLRDGKTVGEMSPKTNYLIKGANAAQANADEKDPRIIAINNSIKAMRAQAVERGLFIISPENYAIVAGYRRPGSAENMPVMSFTPHRPAGGAGQVGDTQDEQKKK